MSAAKRLERDVAIFPSWVNERVEAMEAERHAIADRWARIAAVPEPHRRWWLVPFCACRGHRVEPPAAYCPCRSVRVFYIEPGNERRQRP